MPQRRDGGRGYQFLQGQSGSGLQEGCEDQETLFGEILERTFLFYYYSEIINPWHEA